MEVLTAKGKLFFLLAGCLSGAIAGKFRQNCPGLSKSGDGGQLIVDGKPYLDSWWRTGQFLRRYCGAS